MESAERVDQDQAIKRPLTPISEKEKVIWTLNPRAGVKESPTGANNLGLYLAFFLYRCFLTGGEKVGYTNQGYA